MGWVCPCQAVRDSLALQRAALWRQASSTACMRMRSTRQAPAHPAQPSHSQRHPLHPPQGRHLTHSTLSKSSLYMQIHIRIVLIAGPALPHLAQAHRLCLRHLLLLTLIPWHGVRRCRLGGCSASLSLRNYLEVNPALLFSVVHSLPPGANADGETLVGYTSADIQVPTAASASFSVIFAQISTGT